MQVHEGDILTVEKGIIVHGCNCQGRMGSGLAKVIRDKWPTVYGEYRTIYMRSGLFLGDIISLASTRFDINPDYVNAFAQELPENVIVVNAMTQYDYGRDKNVVYVDYDAIVAAFARVKILAKATGLPVHFPKIGAGLANGDWDIILPSILNTLGHDIEKHLWVLP